MNAKDFLAALNVRTRHDHAPVKTARAQQRRIENVRPVCGSDQDYAFSGFEAVHLDQQCVEGLLAFGVPAAQAGSAMAPNRINFIYEDDAGGVFLALFEKVANAAGAHADEHLDEVRTGNRKERNVRFAGDRAGEQRLARSWRPDEQNALRNASSEFLELLRVFQEVDNLVKLFLGFIDSGNVFECRFLFACAVSRRARDFPKLSALFPPACICRIMKIQNPTSSNNGSRLIIQLSQSGFFTSL